MKEKIAFPQLVELVAAKASTTSRMSELFLQELFATLTQTLENGQSVKIKGLGTFKVIKGNDGKEVSFTPDKDLAEAVNAPFAQFKPVELSDKITQAQLDEIDASMTPDVKQEPVEPQKEQPVQEHEPIAEPTQNSEPEPELAQPLMEQTNEEAPQPSVEVQEDMNEPKQSHKKLWIAIAAVVTLAALLSGLFLHNRNQSEKKPAPAVTDTVKTETKQPVEESDTAALKDVTAVSDTIPKKAKRIAAPDTVGNIKKAAKTTLKHYRHSAAPKSKKGKISKHPTKKTSSRRSHAKKSFKRHRH
jgi:hypothetical protein